MIAHRRIYVAAKLLPIPPSLDDRIADYLLSLLPPGRPRRLARMSKPGETVYSPKEKKRVPRGKYQDISGALTSSMLIEHAHGTVTYAYMPDLAGKARVGVFDVDAGGRPAMVAALEAGRTLGIEMFAIVLPGEQHDGGHVYAIYENFYDAAAIRAQMQQVVTAAGLEITEIWPGYVQPIRGLFGKHQTKGARGELLTQAGEVVDLDTDLQSGFDLVMSLRPNAAPPAILKSLQDSVQTSDKGHYTKSVNGSDRTIKQSPGERAVLNLTQRQGGKGLIPRDEYLAILDQAAMYIREHFDLVSELESAGAVEMNGGFSCPFCEHSHDTTLTIESGGNVGYSHSTRCKLRGDKGFDVTNVLALVHGCNFDRVARKLAPHLWPIPESRRRQRQDPPLVEPTIYRTAAQIQDAQRKRDARKADAAAVLQDVFTRAATDEAMTPADRAVLDTLLLIAGTRDWCRPSKDRIAEMSGYSVGSVKRALCRLEARGYFVSEGDGGHSNLTAVRTFVRGSFVCRNMIHESSNKSLIQPETLGACEARAFPQPENVYAPELDTWEACDPEACGWDLELEQDDIQEIFPAFVEPAPAITHDNSRQEPVVILAPAVEPTLLDRLEAMSDDELAVWVASHAPETVGNTDPDRSFDDSDQPEIATYDPVQLPDVPYTAFRSDPDRKIKPVEYERPYWLRRAGILSGSESAWTPRTVEPDIQVEQPQLLDDESDEEPQILCPPIEPAARAKYFKLRGAARKATNDRQRYRLNKQADEMRVWLPVSEAIAARAASPPIGRVGFGTARAHKLRAEGPPLSAQGAFL